jgi:hypothetical protein
MVKGKKIVYLLGNPQSRAPVLLCSLYFTPKQKHRTSRICLLGRQTGNGVSQARVDRLQPRFNAGDNRGVLG